MRTYFCMAFGADDGELSVRRRVTRQRVDRMLRRLSWKWIKNRPKNGLKTAPNQGKKMFRIDTHCCSWVWCVFEARWRHTPCWRQRSLLGRRRHWVRCSRETWGRRANDWGGRSFLHDKNIATRLTTNTTVLGFCGKYCELDWPLGETTTGSLMRSVS